MTLSELPPSLPFQGTLSIPPPLALKVSSRSLFDSLNQSLAAFVSSSPELWRFDAVWQLLSRKSRVLRMWKGKSGLVPGNRQVRFCFLLQLKVSLPPSPLPVSGVCRCPGMQRFLNTCMCRQSKYLFDYDCSLVHRSVYLALSLTYFCYVTVLSCCVYMFVCVGVASLLGGIRGMQTGSLCIS